LTSSIEATVAPRKESSAVMRLAVVVGRVYPVTVSQSHSLTVSEALTKLETVLL
jgi:hypothetical protein